jgi:hypothetical protein
MPRIYLSTTEFNASPLGLAMAPVVSQLGTGVLDQLLARCSQRCDNYCEKRLQAGGTSTLSQAVSANATTISVASTNTLDNLSEQAVIIDVGNSNQEIISIPPGGVSVTSWTSPYPGTVQLAQPLQFGHVVGAPVQYVYKEVSEAIKASQSDPYSEALQSQAAQLALAHLPPMHVGLTRMAFLKQYPIQNVYTVEHAYSFDTTYNLVFSNSNPAYTGGIIVEPTAGWVRFRVGTVITPEGMVRTTYVGGFDVIPDDIKDAVMWYMADALSLFMNPMGVTDQQMGKRRQSAQLTQGKSPNVQRAEAILRPYKRCV